MIRLILLAMIFFISCSAYAETAEEKCNKMPGKYWTSETLDGKAREFCAENTFYTQSKKKCEEAVEEYEKLQGADSDFMKGCKATQHSKTLANGAKGCLQAAKRCEYCTGSPENDEDKPDCQDDESDEDLAEEDDDGVNGREALLAALQGKETKGKNRYVEQAKRAKKRFKYCPLFAVNKFDKILEFKDKYEKEQQTGREALEEKTAELKEAQSKYEELQAEQAKIVPEYTEEFQKIVVDQNQKLQAALEKNGKDMVEMILNLQTAEMQFIDAKNAIYKVCYDRARQALDRLKEDRRKKISAGTLRSNNGFAGLMNQTSTEKRLRRYAQSVHNNCKSKDTEVRNQIQSAERVYGQQVKRMNLLLNDLQAQQRDISDKLMDAKEDPEEKALLAELKKKYEKRSEDVAKALKALGLNIEALTAAVNRLQENFAKNEQLLALYMEQEEMASKAGAVEDNNAPSVGDFTAAAGAYKAAIDSAYRKCGCKIDSSNLESCETINGDMDKAFGDDKGTKGSGAKARGFNK